MPTRPQGEHLGADRKKAPVREQGWRPWAELHRRGRLSGRRAVAPQDDQRADAQADGGACRAHEERLRPRHRSHPAVSGPGCHRPGAQPGRHWPRNGRGRPPEIARFERERRGANRPRGRSAQQIRP